MKLLAANLLVERYRAPTRAIPILLLAACVSTAAGCRSKANKRAKDTLVETKRDASIDASIVRPDLGEPPASMVRVIAGPVRPGCSGVRDSYCDRHGDRPVLHLNEFYIDKTEVTVTAYRECVDAGACSPPRVDADPRCDGNWNMPDREQHPMNCISGLQAWQYCQFRGKRLPAEAEWERAARGDDDRQYPWGNAKPSCELLVFFGPDCPARGTMRVGSKPNGASPFGALDMLGNVSEIVLVSRSKASLYALSTFITKGGSYQFTSDALRIEDQEDHREGVSVGFRCVRTPKGQPDNTAAQMGL